MKQIEITATVTAARRKNTSYYGNPSYYIDFITPDGESLTGYTATNAACGYGCTNYINKPCRLTYHETRTGNIIIDFMEKV